MIRFSNPSLDFVYGIDFGYRSAMCVNFDGWIDQDCNRSSHLWWHRDGDQEVFVIFGGYLDRFSKIS